MTIVNVEKDGSIEIPTTIMKQLDIEVGDKVVFEVKNGKIILRKEDAIDVFNEIFKTTFENHFNEGTQKGIDK